MRKTCCENDSLGEASANRWAVLHPALNYANYNINQDKNACKQSFMLTLLARLMRVCSHMQQLLGATDTTTQVTNRRLLMCLRPAQRGRRMFETS